MGRKIGGRGGVKTMSNELAKQHTKWESVKKVEGTTMFKSQKEDAERNNQVPGRGRSRSVLISGEKLKGGRSTMLIAKSAWITKEGGLGNRQ